MASRLSVPVQVGVELGIGVAVSVGAAVAEAVAATGVCPSLGEGLSTTGDGITQAAITTSPMTGAKIHEFRLRNLVFSGADLAFTFSI